MIDNRAIGVTMLAVGLSAQFVEETLYGPRMATRREYVLHTITPEKISKRQRRRLRGKAKARKAP